jgi:hypothetical protein
MERLARATADTYPEARKDPTGEKTASLAAELWAAAPSWYMDYVKSRRAGDIGYKPDALFVDEDTIPAPALDMVRVAAELYLESSQLTGGQF